MEKELKIKVTADGNVTIAQLEASIKKVRTEFKSAVIGSNEYNEAAKKLKNTLEQKTQAMKVAQTENAKLMQSYFTLGENLRRNTNPAFISFNQVIQDAPFGIRGVGNNIQFLTQQFTQLRSKGETTGSILKGIMANALTPMGGLMLAVSAGTSLLTVAMDQLGASTKSATAEFSNISTLLDKKFNAGWISSTKYITETNIAINNLIQDVSNPSFIERLANIAQFGLSGIGMMGKITDEESLKLLEVVDREDKILMQSFKRKEDALKIQTRKTDLDIKSLEALKKFIEGESWLLKTDNARLDVGLQLLSLEEKIAEKKKKQTTEMLKQAQLAQEVISYGYGSKEAAAQATFMFGGTEAQFMEGSATSFSPIGDQLGIGPARPEYENYQQWMQSNTARPDPRALAVQRRNDESDEEKRNLEQMADNMRQAMATYRSVFFDPLRASFQAVATGSQSMADAFVESLKQMIVQLLEFAVAAGVLSMFGIGTFGTNFKLISGLSTVNQQVDVRKDMISSLGTSRPPKQVIEFVGVARGEDLHFVQQRYVSKMNAPRI